MIGRKNPILYFVKIASVNLEKMEKSFKKRDWNNFDIAFWGSQVYQNL